MPDLVPFQRATRDRRMLHRASETANDWFLLYAVVQNAMAVPLILLISVLSGESGVILGSDWVRSCDTAASSNASGK